MDCRVFFGRVKLVEIMSMCEVGRCICTSTIHVAAYKRLICMDDYMVMVDALERASVASNLQFLCYLFDHLIMTREQDDDYITVHILDTHVRTPQTRSHVVSFTLSSA